jgi:hypothetical protein
MPELGTDATSNRIVGFHITEENEPEAVGFELFR